MSATGARPSRLASATPLRTLTRRALRVSAASGVTWPPGFSVTLEPISRIRASASVMMSNAFISLYVNVARVTTTATPTVLIEQEELLARIGALAQEIRSDTPSGQLHFVCVLKGAFLFLGDLI